jgi:hypothetical protein
MASVSINLLSVVVAAVSSMALGALWYSPVLFGKQWMALKGMTNMSKEKMEEMKKAAGKGYVAQFIAALITAYVLAYVMAFGGELTAWGGIQGGFWAWLGFVATFSYGQVLWEGMSQKLWILNNAYNLVSLCLMGAIIGAWA